MADRPIRDLPSVSTPTGQILFPVDQGGEAMKLSLFDINDFCNDGSSDSGGVVVTATISSGSTSGTASIGADEIYEYVQNNVPVSLLINRGYVNTYVEARLSHVNKSANGINYTAYFYQDIGETQYATLWVVDENKNISVSSYLDFWQIGSQNDIYVGNNGQHLYLEYEPTDDDDAVSKGYVDSLIASGVASDNVVVLTKDENNKVFNGSTAIKGSQINALASANKAVFMWDSDNLRLYQYAEPNGSGAAVFCRPIENGNGVLVETVSATTNDSTFSSQIVLPWVSASDNGKVLGVVNGAWAKMEPTDGLPEVAVADEGKVLAVDSNGEWSAENPVIVSGTDAQVNNAVADYLDTEGVTSPTVSVSEITGGHRITITDVNHPQGQSIDVMDGEDTGVVTDTTLTVSGAAADAAVTGERFDDLLTGYDSILFEITENEYVRKTNQTPYFVQNQGDGRTGYIPVTPGETIFYEYAITTDATYNAFYDANKAFLQAFTVKADDNSFVIPIGASYMALSNTLASIRTLKLKRKSVLVLQSDLDGKILTSDIKNAIIDCLENVAWVNDNGASKIANLRSLFNPGSGTSDMDGWTHAVPYRNLTIVDHSYVRYGDGSIRTGDSYSWKRTGYVPCDGANKITFPACPQTVDLVNGKAANNCFYDSSKSFVSAFSLNTDNSTEIAVPSNAAFFIISTQGDVLPNLAAGGITPYAY